MKKFLKFFISALPFTLRYLAFFNKSKLPHIYLSRAYEPVLLLIQIPGQRVAVHLQLLGQTAYTDALVPPGANIVFPVIKSFPFPAFSERTSQLDACLFLCSQRLARTLWYKVALDLGRLREGKSNDFGIQGVRQLEVVLDGINFYPLLGACVQDAHHHHHVAAQSG